MVLPKLQKYYVAKQALKFTTQPMSIWWKRHNFKVDKKIVEQSIKKLPPHVY
jgi:hypothetical protein